MCTVPITGEKQLASGSSRPTASAGWLAGFAHAMALDVCLLMLVDSDRMGLGHLYLSCRQLPCKVLRLLQFNATSSRQRRQACVAVAISKDYLAIVHSLSTAMLLAAKGTWVQHRKWACMQCADGPCRCTVIFLHTMQIRAGMLMLLPDISSIRLFLTMYSRS
jgi:hypothetical protein